MPFLLVVKSQHGLRVESETTFTQARLWNIIAEGDGVLWKCLLVSLSDIAPVCGDWRWKNIRNQWEKELTKSKKPSIGLSCTDIFGWDIWRFLPYPSVWSFVWNCHQISKDGTDWRCYLDSDWMKIWSMMSSPRFLVSEICRCSFQGKSWFNACVPLKWCVWRMTTWPLDRLNLEDGGRHKKNHERYGLSDALLGRKNTYPGRDSYYRVTIVVLYWLLWSFSILAN